MNPLTEQSKIQAIPSSDHEKSWNAPLIRLIRFMTGTYTLENRVIDLLIRDSIPHFLTCPQCGFGHLQKAIVPETGNTVPGERPKMRLRCDRGGCDLEIAYSDTTAGSALKVARTV